MDDFEKRTKIIRAYEIHRGDVTKAWKQIKDTFANAYTEDAFRKAVKEGSELFQSIELRPIIEEERIRVGISGEIYVAMEPAVNMDIEERLGDMGVEVENCQYISDWVRHNARPKWAGKSHAQKLVDKGARYIPIGLGGHEQENIGAIVDYAERGFDGAVHLLPFGCLPELFTQSTLPIVSKKLDMPILSLSIDEQTGRANSLTRLEAFVDLIKNKRFDKKAAV